MQLRTQAQNTLYMVATPIGNLQDLTERAKTILSSVDFIACEDTRVTGKLKVHLGLKAKLFNCNAHNERQSAQKIITLLRNGHSVAFVSDAGTPGLSDPGNLLVQEIVEAGFKVCPIPGTSSMATILSVCGFNLSGGFHFSGFLPRSEGKLKKLLDKVLIQLQTPLVALEAPYRISKSLQLIANHFPNANICLGRELTKLHEEILRGSCSQLASINLTEKGEFIMVIELSKQEAKLIKKTSSLELKEDWEDKPEQVC